MAIFDRIPKEELGTVYTHYGWLLGLVPVYVGDADSAAPRLAERNWIPVWWFDLVEGLFGLCCFIASMLDPMFEPSYAIKVGKRIRP